MVIFVYKVEWQQTEKASSNKRGTAASYFAFNVRCWLDVKCTITTSWSNTISGWLEMEVLQGQEVAVDWCRAYHINLNDEIFICIVKGFCSRCKCVKKEVSCFQFCTCVCIAARENIVGYLNLYICIDVFRTQSNIYDGAFLRK